MGPHFSRTWRCTVEFLQRLLAVAHSSEIHKKIKDFSVTLVDAVHGIIVGNLRIAERVVSDLLSVIKYRRSV